MPCARLARGAALHSGARATAAVVCRGVEREGEGELRLVGVHGQLRLRARRIAHEEGIVHAHLHRICMVGAPARCGGVPWLGQRGHGGRGGRAGLGRAAHGARGGARTAAAASPNCAASVGAIRSRIAPRNQRSSAGTACTGRSVVGTWLGFGFGFGLWFMG